MDEEFELILNEQAESDWWAAEAARQDAMGAVARRLGHVVPMPSKAEAEAAHAAATENAFDPDQPRDDGGRWAAGGGSTGERLKAAVAHVSRYDAGDIGHHHGLADRAVRELRALPKEQVHTLARAAGIEGIKPTDSKKGMLLRVHNRITAGVRARERNEV